MANLIVRKQGAVAWLLISNPGASNAINYETLRALPEIYDSLGRDPNVRVIVMTGDADGDFSSGYEAAELERMRTNAGASALYDQTVGDVVRAIGLSYKPTIARIRGACMGIAMSLAVRCDILVCSDDAQFSQPTARLGRAFSAHAAKRLVEVIGPLRAAEMLCTARVYSAAEALDMGLVNCMVPLAKLDETVAAYCADVAEGAPLTIASVKRAIFEATSAQSERDPRGLQNIIEASNASEDYREGLAALLARRKPVFRGR